MSRGLLFRAESHNLGLIVTRAMQREAVASEASFQDEFGQFSEGALCKPYQCRLF